jgi:hypothetical protein
VAGASASLPQTLQPCLRVYDCCCCAAVRGSVPATRKAPGEALPWAPLPGAESFGSAAAGRCRFSVALSPQRAASESARVQPLKRSQAVSFRFRSAPLPVSAAAAATATAAATAATAANAGGLDFPAESPLADRRCRFAVAPARCPLLVDRHRLHWPHRSGPSFRGKKKRFRVWGLAQFHYPCPGFPRPLPRTKILNPKSKKSPPPAVRARPSPKSEARGRAWRLCLRLSPASVR